MTFEQAIRLLIIGVEIGSIYALVALRDRKSVV